MAGNLAGHLDPSAEEPCATCDHEARHHWVKIISPSSGECDRGDCACTRFVRLPKMETVWFQGGPWDGQFKEVRAIVTLIKVPNVRGEYWLNTSSDNTPTYFWNEV